MSGRSSLGTSSFCLYFDLCPCLYLVVVFALQVGTGPVVDAAAAGFGNLRIHARFVLQLERPVGRNIDVEFFVEVDVVLVEIVVSPELAAAKARVNHRDHVILQHFAGTQAGDGDVLLAIVGVDRSFVARTGALRSCTASSPAFTTLPSALITRT